MEDRNERRRKRGLSGLLAAIVLTGSIGGSYVLGQNSVKSRYTYSPTTMVTSKESVPVSSDTEEKKNQDPADWNKLNRIKEMLYQYYDGPIDENKLLEGAIKGMVESLDDPYTVFYNAEEFKSLNEQNEGKFIGVGLQVATKDGHIIVVAPIDGGPAKEAGIKTGDIILKVDGKIYSDKELEDAVKHMRGEAGKEVTLTVKRGEEELDFTVKRREITTKAVKYEMLENNLGYIILTQFTKDSDKEFKKALDDLKKQGAKGYIVDFRGNPGGYLNASINIASNFIEKGKVVVTTKDKYNETMEDDSRGGEYIGVPMVLLIDEGSASASEVVAGALKDYEAATILGVKSFGKGIVQTVMDLPKGEGIKITISAYYSPKGTNIHKIGIEPEIEVMYPEELKKEEYDKNKDPQLNKAIEVLKEKISKTN